MRRSKLVIIACVLFAAAFLALAATQRPAASGTPTLFEGARLIAGDGNAPIENLPECNLSPDLMDDLMDAGETPVQYLVRSELQETNRNVDEDCKSACEAGD